MKKLKMRLVIGIVLTMMISTQTVFAKSGKLFAANTGGYEGVYSDINVTNYIGRVNEGLTFDKYGNSPSPYGGFYKNETALAVGETTLTMTFGKNETARMFITPATGKTKNGKQAYGKEKEYKRNEVAVLGPGEYFILLLTREINDTTGNEGPWSGYVRVVEDNKTMPTSSKVLVDKKAVSFEAYTIEDNNYIKLRDFAYAVTGTDKQFDVGWDSEKSAINLISKASYAANGSELLKGDGKAKSPVLNKSKIYKDGQQMDLKAYTIDQNNYFKLRDLADAFDIEITWDQATSSIGINTSF